MVTSNQLHQRETDAGPTVVTATAELTIQSPKPRIQAGDSVARANVVVGAHVLYPETSPATPLLGLIRLLGDAVAACDDALSGLSSNDNMLASDALAHAQLILEEAFCLKESDGSGAVILSVTNALRSSVAVPTFRQVTIVRKAIEDLLAAPLIDMEGAILIVDRLEDSGLNVETPGLEVVVDWLSD